MKATLATTLMLMLAATASAQWSGKTEGYVFKEYGFAIEHPLPLKHEPTETTTDAEGHPVKIDRFFTEVVDAHHGGYAMFSVVVQTFDRSIEKGVDADYLVRVLESRTDKDTTMGKPEMFPLPVGKAPIAVMAPFTLAKKDGKPTYMSMLVCAKGSRVFLVLAQYTEQPPAKFSDDFETGLWFVTFKVL